jgi:hypothetical protein
MACGRLRPQPSSRYTHSGHPSGLEAWLSLEGPTSVPQAHDTARLGLEEMPHTLNTRGHPDSRVTPT